MRRPPTPCDAQSPASDAHRRSKALEDRPCPIGRPAAQQPRKEVRRVLRRVQDDDTGLAAQLVEVRCGSVYYEVLAKVKGRPEVIHTFSHRGSAERVFEIASHGVLDLNTPLLDLPRTFWKWARADQGPSDMVKPAALLVPGFTAGPDPECRVCQPAAQ